MNISKSTVVILFVHLPKNAGTTISAIASKIGCLTKDHDIRRKGFVQLRDLPKDTLSQYRTFTVVRNPWDRVVSAFYYLRAGGRNVEDYKDRERILKPFQYCFERFVKDGLVNQPRLITEQLHFRPQHDWICSDSDIIVNDVLRFENLQYDLDRFLKSCSRPSVKLPILNSSNRFHYKDCYDHEMQEIVQSVYLQDIHLLSYSF
jgi:hypothetical protein